MAQNMFTYGKKHEEYTEEDASREFERVGEALREQARMIELPEELSAEHMISLLENVTPGEAQPVRAVNYKREYTKFIACAACLVLAIVGFGRFVGRQSDLYYADAAGTNYTYAAVSAAAMVEAEEAVPETAKEEPAAKAADADGAPVESAVTLAAVQDSSQIPAEKLVMVNGALYRNTGEVRAEREQAEADGEILRTVDTDETPGEDGESNFGTGYSYYLDGDTVVVVIDGEALVFRN